MSDLSNIEEKVIIKGLVTDQTYFDKMMPYLYDKLFSEDKSRKMFECISKYFQKYNKKPNAQVIDLFVGTVKNISEDLFKGLSNLLDYIKEEGEHPDTTWLEDETIAWIRKRKYYNAIVEAANHFEKEELDTELPSKISDALGFSIDETIGLELADLDNKWEAYTSITKKYPFSLNAFNLMTNGGVERGTINLFMSSTTGGGKTLCKCFIAGQYLLQGLNVLYITLEMSPDNITKRIDASLLDIPMDDIVKLGEQGYKNRMGMIMKPTSGRLIVKQFPPTTCSVNHIRKLMKDLKMKKNFVPDVIFVDYLQLMASSRYNSDKKYMVLQSASEELRGLAIEENLICWTSTQSNRTGLEKPEEMGLDSISESYGITFGADLIFALVNNDQFREDNKLYVKVLKNRYAPIDLTSKCFIGVNYSKMTIYDLDSSDEDAKTIFSSADLSKSYSSQLDKARAGMNFGDLK